jgi:hypothetical protein
MKTKTEKRVDKEIAHLVKNGGMENILASLVLYVESVAAPEDNYLHRLGRNLRKTLDEYEARYEID